ncbi:molybdopterin-dependent oxidoreductase [Gordonibacter sp. An230]|uniref:molybdopterin-dependent oxidoreductase n=1 Tax=Gordonibacter sp. An230 TaxID=1965592 RepID=UPI0013A65C07|nr:molybdopterin-dependent oxidoreductase [Gordonibacter sp. An230]
MGIIDHAISRKDFLRASTAAAAVIAAAGVSGCSPRERTADEPASGKPRATICENDQLVLEGKGEWKPAICWSGAGCGGMCLNKAYVVDGVVVRSGTDNDHDDTEANPQWRACPRGRSKRQNVYGVERLKYPIKRKHWQPGGGENSNGHLRGVDEWERITWDEAIDLVGSEIKRIYDEYGPRSVLGQFAFDASAYSFFSKLGGFMQMNDTVSYGSYTPFVGPLGFGYMGEPGLPAMNDRLDLKNADYIVLDGCNPAWASAGNPMFYFQQARDAGTQYAYIGPSYNLTAAALDAKWIPLRNGTDTPFLLGVAYEMLRLEEEEGGIVDWEFLGKYCVGFDLEHMPDDATLDECFKDYVLGAYDGVPKTPEWASQFCGTPVEDFTWLARVMGKQNKTMFLFSFAGFRTNGSENLAQLIMTVACMGGHAGKSGHGFGPGAYGPFAANGGEMLVSPGLGRIGDIPNPLEECGIPTIVGWQAIVDGKYTSYDEGVLTGDCSVFHEPVEHELNIKMIYALQQNPLHSRGNGQLKGVEAFRKVEFVCTQDVFVSDTAMFSDIVLPIVSQWEGNWEPSEGDLVWPVGLIPLRGDVNGNRNKEILPVEHPVIKPLFEAKSDYWVQERLCEKVGIDPEELFPVSQVQFYFDIMAGATYRAPDGEYKRLFSIRQETADKYHVDNKPQDGGVMDLEEYFERGVFSVPRDDGYVFIKYGDFIEDPEGHPLETASGKFEIYCQAKADGLNRCQLSEEPIKPYANYFTPNSGYVSSFEDWEGKVPGKYPYLLYQPHYIRRAHTQNDGSTWLREALENPIFISAVDAEAKGVKTGDTVRVFNDYGQVLRQASVMASIMPGCVGLPHGAHFDLDESDPENPIDLAGSENMLQGPDHSNYLYSLSPYNTTLVDFERYDGGDIPRDCERDIAHIDFPEA